MAGPVTALGCHDCLLVAGDPGQPLVAIGLGNLLAVALPDAVLVAPMGKAAALAPIAQTSFLQKQAPRRVYRPWAGLKPWRKLRVLRCVRW